MGSDSVLITNECDHVHRPGARRGYHTTKHTRNTHTFTLIPVDQCLDQEPQTELGPVSTRSQYSWLLFSLYRTVFLATHFKRGSEEELLSEFTVIYDTPRP